MVLPFFCLRNCFPAFILDFSCHHPLDFIPLDFESSVTPLSSDRILTLSTCSYEFSDARFVVLGILKKYDTLGITVMRT